MKPTAANVQHFDPDEHEIQEPSSAMDVDQDLANALQDLSSVSMSIIKRISFARDY